MARYICFSVLLFAFAGLGPPDAYTQSLSSFVISPAGGIASSSTGVSLSATVGEMSAVATIQSGSFILTQGFGQPEGGPTTRIESQVPENVSIAVYPNPSSGRFRVQILGNTGDGAVISIFSVLGVVVHQGYIPAATGTNHVVTYELPLQGLYPGTYLLQIRTASAQVITQRYLHIIR